MSTSNRFNTLSLKSHTARTATGARLCNLASTPGIMPLRSCSAAEDSFGQRRPLELARVSPQRVVRNPTVQPRLLGEPHSLHACIAARPGATCHRLHSVRRVAPHRHTLMSRTLPWLFWTVGPRQLLPVTLRCSSKLFRRRLEQQRHEPPIPPPCARINRGAFTVCRRTQCRGAATAEGITW